MMTEDHDVLDCIDEVTETLIGYIGQFLDEKSEFSYESVELMLNTINNNVHRYIKGDIHE